MRYSRNPSNQDDVCYITQDGLDSIKTALAAEGLDGSRNFVTPFDAFHEARKVLRRFGLDLGTPKLSASIRRVSYDPYRIEESDTDMHFECDGSKVKAHLRNADDDVRKNPGRMHKSDPGYLHQSIRSTINEHLSRSGLDGNTYYEKPQHGYVRALDILAEYNIELGEVVDSWAFTHPSHHIYILLAKKTSDPFAPIDIPNTQLSLSWHKMQSGRFEVIAYLS